MDRRTILIAEDSDLLRFVTKRQMAMLGASCDTARDGEEALSMWRHDPSRYWLLITDLEMPRLNGFDLARSVRSDCSAGARLPIVAYSGSAQPEEIERGRRSGIDDFLAKPADLHRLNSMLQRWRPRLLVRSSAALPEATMRAYA